MPQFVDRAAPVGLARATNDRVSLIIQEVVRRVVASSTPLADTSSHLPHGLLNYEPTLLN
jgi:hypothetical protein